MKLQFKYDIYTTCKVIMKENLDKLGFPYEITGLGEIEVKCDLSSCQYEELKESIKKYGIELISDPKNSVAQRIKDVIIEMVYMEEKRPNLNTSDYIADKMNLSYGYLSSVFAEVTYTSIGNFIILHRIEYAKQLISEGTLNLTEIAWKLNYSSLAHLSNQFKKTTGLAPTTFQRIIKMRNNTNS